MKRARQRKKRPESYRQRNYRRQLHQAGLTPFTVQVKETDLHIQASSLMEEEALETVLLARGQLERYIARHHRFLTTLAPLPADPLAPPLVKAMLGAGLAAGTGPMAAVAGAIAEQVGRSLLAGGAAEVVVENGGDIFLARNREARMAIFAGPSPLSKRFALVLRREQQPTGVCTSSASVGHSLSRGRADAVTVVAGSTALADAWATAIGNRVTGPEAMSTVLEFVATIADITGVVIICGDRLGVWGDLQLERL